MSVSTGNNFQADDWTRLGYLGQTDSLPNNLTTPILPIFDYGSSGRINRWTVSKNEDRVYHNLAKENWDTFQPVLRLASAMIQSPASKRFIHAILYGRREKLHTLSEKTGLNYYAFYRTTNSPDSEVNADVAKVWPSLAPKIRWVLEQDRLMIANQPAYTQIIFDTCCIKHDGTMGIASEVYIRASHCPTIDKLRERGTQYPRLLRFQFAMAKVLCHEVIHCIGNATNTEKLQFYDDRYRRGELNDPGAALVPPEPYFEDDRAAELGDCWENAVFGGKISMADKGMILWICKWPSVYTEGYGHVPKRRAMKRSWTFYLVNSRWAQQIQRQNFWDEMPSTSTVWLHVPKTLGKREYADDDAETDPDWHTQSSSEGRRPADEANVVRR
ncbi:hypothetical protein MMC28_001649 [Mycoblastus sanguinarius]|nr:hypothetical protein [Mycoblastus sanguinarius]